MKRVILEFDTEATLADIGHALEALAPVNMKLNVGETRSHHGSGAKPALRPVPGSGTPLPPDYRPPTARSMAENPPVIEQGPIVHRRSEDQSGYHYYALDIEETCRRLGLEREHIMARAWPEGTVEHRLKLSMARLADRGAPRRRRGAGQGVEPEDPEGVKLSGRGASPRPAAEPSGFGERGSGAGEMEGAAP